MPPPQLAINQVRTKVNLPHPNEMPPSNECAPPPLVVHGGSEVLGLCGQISSSVFSAQNFVHMTMNHFALGNRHSLLNTDLASAHQTLKHPWTIQATTCAGVENRFVVKRYTNILANLHCLAVTCHRSQVKSSWRSGLKRVSMKPVRHTCFVSYFQAKN